VRQLRYHAEFQGFGQQFAQLGKTFRLRAIAAFDRRPDWLRL